MSCCGDPDRWPPAPPLPLSEPLPIVYLGRSTVTVRGAFTGRSYTFGPGQRAQSVAAEDARVFLRTRYFRRSR